MRQVSSFASTVDPNIRLGVAASSFQRMALRDGNPRGKLVTLRTCVRFFLHQRRVLRLLWRVQSMFRVFFDVIMFFPFSFPSSSGYYPPRDSCPRPFHFCFVAIPSRATNAIASLPSNQLHRPDCSVRPRSQRCMLVFRNAFHVLRRSLSSNAKNERRKCACRLRRWRLQLPWHTTSCAKPRDDDAVTNVAKQAHGVEGVIRISSVTPGNPDSFEAMLFFVPLAVRHKTPTANQFIGQPPGLISRLVDKVSGRTGTERDPATGGSFGIFEGTTKGEDVVRTDSVNHKLCAGPSDRDAGST